MDLEALSKRFFVRALETEDVGPVSTHPFLILHL